MGLSVKPSVNFILLILITVLLLPNSGYSQGTDTVRYPSKPITYISPLVPGSPADVAIRVISKEAEKFLGQPITVINKPGAANTIGVAALAASKPDGYTIGYTPPSSLFTMPFFEKLSYHPIKDLQQIMQFGTVVFAVFVKGESPFKSFKDLIAYARQNPKKATYGTSGSNSIQNLFMEQIAKKEGVQFTHIPFKGSVEAEMAVLGDHTVFGAGIFTHSLIESGKERLILLFMEERPAEYPGIPNLKDVGFDIPYPGPLSVVGPKGIPQGIVKTLEEAYTKAMKEPAFIKAMKELHFPIIHRDSKSLSDNMAHAYDVYEKIIKEVKVTK